MWLSGIALKLTLASRNWIEPLPYPANQVMQRNDSNGNYQFIIEHKNQNLYNLTIEVVYFILHNI